MDHFAVTIKLLFDCYIHVFLSLVLSSYLNKWSQLQHQLVNSFNKENFKSNTRNTIIFKDKINLFIGFN